jgi:hypothetical protein
MKGRKVALRGDLVAGERLGERAFQLGQEAGQPDAVFIYGAQIAFVRAYQGRGEEMIAMLEQSVEAYPNVPAWRAALASFLCWLDRRGRPLKSSSERQAIASSMSYPQPVI